MIDHIGDEQNNKQIVYATIGAFDGVHIGHQHLIKTMVETAREHSAKTAVVTFHPHPAVYLKSLKMPFYITTQDEKRLIFSQLGVDFVVDIDFSKEISEMEPGQFIDMLLEKFSIKQLWLGKDFALGKNRSGNIDVLSAIGENKDFKIIDCPHIEDTNGKISSSQIRNWIKSGDFISTSTSLNRYYSIEGLVISGDARGRKIGFPTANLDVWEGKLLPISGVYATWISFDNEVFPSVTNVGIRPTFEVQNNPKPRIEVHILNFDQNIYNKKVKLDFVEQIRLEKKFKSVEELVNQIQRDAWQAEEILKNVIKPTGLLT